MATSRSLSVGGSAESLRLPFARGSLARSATPVDGSRDKRYRPPSGERRTQAGCGSECSKEFSIQTFANRRSLGDRSARPLVRTLPFVSVERFAPIYLPLPLCR